jgi:predicted ABC-type ATPase
MKRDPSLSQVAANGLAWRIGVCQLERAIAGELEYFFETTLGGRTVVRVLEHALHERIDVRIWYVGLATVHDHIERVASRVRAGGHDIPEAAIRKRFDDSRRNLVRLLPRLTELKVYDNTEIANPSAGERPRPTLVLHYREGRIAAPQDLRDTPAWAKPIVAQVLKQAR